MAETASVAEDARGEGCSGKCSLPFSSSPVLGGIDHGALRTVAPRMSPSRSQGVFRGHPTVPLSPYLPAQRPSRTSLDVVDSCRLSRHWDHAFLVVPTRPRSGTSAADRGWLLVGAESWQTVCLLGVGGEEQAHEDVGIKGSSRRCVRQG